MLLLCSILRHRGLRPPGQPAVLGVTSKADCDMLHPLTRHHSLPIKHRHLPSSHPHLAAYPSRQHRQAHVCRAGGPSALSHPAPRLYCEISDPSYGEAGARALGAAQEQPGGRVSGGGLGSGCFRGTTPSALTQGLLGLRSLFHFTLTEGGAGGLVIHFAQAAHFWRSLYFSANAFHTFSPQSPNDFFDIISD